MDDDDDAVIDDDRTSLAESRQMSVVCDEETMMSEGVTGEVFDVSKRMLMLIANMSCWKSGCGLI